MWTTSAVKAKLESSVFGRLDPYWIAPPVESAAGYLDFCLPTSSPCSVVPTEPSVNK